MVSGLLGKLEPLFQFRLGTIESLAAYLILEGGLLFQFRLGTIESV